jgi:hypothetical protein
VYFKTTNSCHCNRFYITIKPVFFQQELQNFCRKKPLKIAQKSPRFLAVTAWGEKGDFLSQFFLDKGGMAGLL